MINTSIWRIASSDAIFVSIGSNLRRTDYHILYKSLLLIDSKPCWHILEPITKQTNADNSYFIHTTIRIVYVIDKTVNAKLTCMMIV